MRSKNALILLLGFFTLASTYRAIHFWTTGFYVPDELGYTVSTWKGVLNYQDRFFFNLFNSFYFSLFRIESIDKQVALLPLYIMSWSSLGIFSAYRSLKLLRYADNVVGNTLALSVLMPVFSLFSVTFLTEPVAFSTTMLGIYLTVRFLSEETSHLRFLLPLMAALTFVAAAYTRQDFIIFQVLGFIPFLFREAQRKLVRVAVNWKSFASVTAVALLFIVPSSFFLFYPSHIGYGAVDTVLRISASQASQTTSLVTSTATKVTVVNNETMTFTTAVTSTLTSSVPPSPFLQYFFLSALPQAIRLFFTGLGSGMNPVFLIIIMISIALSLWDLFHRRNLTLLPLFSIGLLSLGVFAGVSLIFAPIARTLPASSLIRYSFDASPAFFIFAPTVLGKFKSRRPYTFVFVGILIFAAVAGVEYQAALQSNLGNLYPFLSGNDQFLLPNYRAPYAQLRDYFRLTPTGGVLVLGEVHGDLAPRSLALDWSYTPGTASIARPNFQTYVSLDSLVKIHPASFYVYIEKGGMSYFNASNTYLLRMINGTFNSGVNGPPIHVTEVHVIYSRPQMLLSEISLEYGKQ